LNPAFYQMSELFVRELIYTVSSIAGGMIVYQLLFYFLRRWARRKKRAFPALLNKYIYYPGLLLISAIIFWLAIGLIRDHMSLKYYGITRHFILVFAIAAAGFVLVRMVTLLMEITVNYYATDDLFDYSYRKAKTKFQLIHRVLNFLIVLTVASAILMTFSSIRQLGSTLLASAGVVGLIIGFAAQKSLGALFAGIQIAISQPVRIDDKVIVEGQFGTVSEITLTYVVVNIWDGRRLVVPINFFLEKSFENWTRQSPELIGKVKIFADYSLPVEEVRAEFMSWMEASALWDKRSCGLNIIDANEKNIEIQATMSAGNTDDAFALQTYIREKLITHLREKYPHCLPVARVELLSPERKTGL
jgi:small-conductance mechanosensitive channel